MKFVKSGGRGYIVAGGDSYDNAELSEPNTLRVWSLPELEFAWERAGDRGIIDQLDFGTVGGRDLLFIGADGWGPTVVVDFSTQEDVFVDDEAKTVAWFARVDGKALLLSERMGRLGAIEIEEGDGKLSFAAERHLADVRNTKQSDVGSIDGRPVLLVATGALVRVWDLKELVAAQARPPRAQPTYYRAHAGGGDAIFAITMDDDVVAWDPQTGAPLWSVRGIERHLRALTRGRRRMRKVVIVADELGEIHVIEEASHRVVKSVVKAGGSIECLAFANDGARNVVFATVNVGSLFRVQAFDLDTGLEILPDWLKRHGWGLAGGEGDKPLHALAVSPYKEDVRVLAGGKYAKLLAANLHEDLGHPLYGFREWRYPGSDYSYVHALAIDEVNEQVAIGDGDGMLAFLNLNNGARLGAKAAAHNSQINSIAFAPSGDGLLATGSVDGFIKIWRYTYLTELELLHSFEIDDGVLNLIWVDKDRLAVGGTRGLVMVKLDLEIIEASHAH